MHEEAGDFLAKMYESLPGGVYRQDLEVAGMAKYIAKEGVNKFIAPSTMF